MKSDNDLISASLGKREGKYVTQAKYCGAAAAITFRTL